MFYGLLSIVLMTLDHQGRYVDRLHDFAWRAFEPVLIAAEAPFSLGRDLGESLESRRELLRRIERLQRQRDLDRARLALLEDLRDDNAELRDLISASQRLEPEFLAAELMGIDLNPWSHRVLVNRGRLDGLRPGQPVMASRGVVGQVDRAGRRSAAVILISDPDHALPVRVQRTGLRTVAYGSGHIQRLRLSDLPMNVDLQAGDRLVTSGLGDTFPPGLPVAEVEGVERPTGEAFATARARPLARLDRARHVLVIRDRARRAASAEGEAEAEAEDGDDAGGES